MPCRKGKMHDRQVTDKKRPSPQRERAVAGVETLGTEPDQALRSQSWTWPSSSTSSQPVNMALMWAVMLWPVVVM